MGIRRYKLEYVGVDICRPHLEEFLRKHPEAKLFCRDVCEDDLFTIGMFDVVFVPYTFIHLFEFNMQRDILIKLGFMLKRGGIIILDVMDPGVLGESGDISRTVSIPKTNGGSCEILVHIATKETHERLARASWLHPLGRIPYLFAEKSRQEYLVLQVNEDKQK